MTKAPLAGEKTGPTPRIAASAALNARCSWEADGVPIGLCVAGAKRNDFKLLGETVETIALERRAPSRRHPQHLCLDKGYDFEEVRALTSALGFVAHIRSRGEETKDKKPQRRARRWVVERTHGWFNRFRSILTRWAKKTENYLGLLHFVCGMTAYRAAGLFG
jgi:putative transposase